MRTKTLRYGLGFSAGHLFVIAGLIPLKVIFREDPVGILAWQIHRVVDFPVWDVPRLLTGLVTSKTLTQATLSMFPGPSASPALISLELAIFGVTGGLFYFVLGIVISWLITSIAGQQGPISRRGRPSDGSKLQ